MFTQSQIVRMLVSNMCCNTLSTLGPEDNVKCYWCGGCLKAWQPTDQPMVEHLRWFPDCWLSQQQQLESSAQSAVSICLF